MIRKTLNILILLGTCVVLSGCLESAGVTLHEPGEYRGGQHTLQYDDGALKERFSNFQDR